MTTIEKLLINPFFTESLQRMNMSFEIINGGIKIPSVFIHPGYKADMITFKTKPNGLTTFPIGTGRDETAVSVHEDHIENDSIILSSRTPEGKTKETITMACDERGRMLSIINYEGFRQRGIEHSIFQTLDNKQVMFRIEKPYENISIYEDVTIAPYADSDKLDIMYSSYDPRTSSKCEVKCILYDRNYNNHEVSQYLKERYALVRNVIGRCIAEIGESNIKSYFGKNGMHSIAEKQLLLLPTGKMATYTSSHRKGS